MAMQVPKVQPFQGPDPRRTQRWGVGSGPHMVDELGTAADHTETREDGHSESGAATRCPTCGQRWPGPKKYKTEQYAVCWQWYEFICKKFNVQPTRDCFATPQNTRCAEFFTADQDALRQDWTKGGIWWINPPWALWPKVVDKLMGATILAVCIFPAWNTMWMKTLLDIADLKLYIPKGTYLLEIDGQQSGPTRWAAWALLVTGQRFVPPKPNESAQPDWFWSGSSRRRWRRKLMLEKLATQQSTNQAGH